MPHKNHVYTKQTRTEMLPRHRRKHQARSPLTHDTIVQSEGSGPLRHGDGTGGSQAGDRILEKTAGPDERVMTGDQR